jgi:hypothetical protein
MPLAQTGSAGATYVKVEGASFQLSANRYVHKFIFSEPLRFRNLTSARLLQNGGLIVSNDGTSVMIENGQPFAILNLSGVVADYVSVNNNYPSDTVYGVSADTSYRSYLSRDYAVIGYLFSLGILLTQCLFVGVNLMYKMDNLIIFSQGIFYFLFVRVLISNPVGQYYYGWHWMHLGWFPNYFSASVAGTASSAAPYALFNLDANFIRNAGSALSFFFTFCLAWGVVSLAVWLLDAKVHRAEIWFGHIFRNSFCAVFELLSLGVFYWAVAYSHYDQGGSSDETFAGLTAFCIIAIIFYTLIRTYFDRIASAYMVKRIVYASVLGSSY